MIAALQGLPAGQSSEADSVLFPGGF